MIWKLLLRVDHVLFWILMVLVVLGMLGKVKLGRSAKAGNDGRVEFGPSWFAFCFVGMLAALLPIMLVDYLHHRTERLAALQLIFIGLLLVMSLFDLPGTIVTGSEGLEQIRWLQRHNRIRWGDIVEIDSSPKSRLVIIKAENGTKITHSFSHAGRERLLLEIKQHCGDNLPPDFPRESRGPN